jgi:hypothetical protein
VRGTRTQNTVDDEALRRPQVEPVLVKVPAIDIVMIDGAGDPNTSADYAAAMSALYAYSYPVVITLKKAGRTDLKVGPLEGLWWADDVGREPAPGVIGPARS